LARIALTVNPCENSKAIRFLQNNKTGQKCPVFCFDFVGANCVRPFMKNAGERSSPLLFGIVNF